MFDDFVDRIYPIELEIEDITGSARSASYQDFTTKEMPSMGPLRTFHLYVAIFQQNLHIEYSVQHYVIKFFSDLRHVGGFLRVLRFPSPIKLTSTI
jgi:hypothetical protein